MDAEQAEGGTGAARVRRRRWVRAGVITAAVGVLAAGTATAVSIANRPDVDCSCGGDPSDVERTTSTSTSSRVTETLQESTTVTP